MKQLLLLMSCLSVFGCTRCDESLGINENTNLRNNANEHDYLIRDYGNIFGVFSLDDGSYLYCEDCNNNLDLDSDISISGSVTVDTQAGYVLIKDKGKNVSLSIFLPKHKSMIDEDLFDSNIEVSSIGYSYGDHENTGYVSSSNNSWIPDTFNDFVEALPDCQCVGNTSTPCTTSGGDNGLCDVGGPGSTSCGVSSVAGGGVTVMGNGGSGTTSGGCSIGCDAGMYACCYYTST